MNKLLTYIKSSYDPDVYYIPQIDRYTYEWKGVKQENYYMTAEYAQSMLINKRWLDLSIPTCEDNSILRRIPSIVKESEEWQEHYNNQMQDVMLDIETLDTKQGAVILSIGAVYFNRNTGITGKQFYRKIDLQSCLENGFTINADTLQWWMQQDDKARQEVMKIYGCKTEE